MRRPASTFWTWLVRAYPAEFRAEYGQEVVATLDERWREERGSSRFRFCVEAITDVLVTAFRERCHVLIRDLVYSFRRLAAHPGVAVIAILSLALGIGANTAMFSVLYASLLRPLPYSDVERRVVVFTTALNSSDPNGWQLAAPADIKDWREQSRMLDDWHVFALGGATTALGAGVPERVTTQHITAGLMESLGVRPVIGRFFHPGEERQHLALISEGYWQRSFGGSPDVLGRKITVFGRVHTIVGVVPAGFELMSEPSSVDFWNAVDLSPGSEWMQRKAPWVLAMATRRPGISVAQAQSEMEGIASGLASTYPDTNRHRGVRVAPVQEAMRGWMGSYLYPLFGAVAFVLLIACTNVASLLLARAAARRREIAVRAALGASRNRLFREFLADGLMLAIPGTLAGLAIAYGGIALFHAVAPEGFPRSSTVGMNAPVLWFTVLAGMLAGILSAVAPAVTGSRVDLADSMKDGSKSSAGRTRQKVRSAMVVAEIALSLILLVAAGLTLNSLLRLSNHNPGFDPQNVTVAELHLTGTRYSRDAPVRDMDMRYVQPATQQFIEHVLREVRTLPGVQSAALAAGVPMGPNSSPAVGVRVSGSTDVTGNLRTAVYNVVTNRFFETLGIALRRGRYLEQQDAHGSRWVAVVNETFAREFFPNADAIGQVVNLTEGPESRPREIVGVVADATQFSPRMPIQPEVYTSHFQQVREIPGNFQGSRFRVKLIVRSQTASAVTRDAIVRIVSSFDPDLLVAGVRPLQQHVAMRAGSVRFYASTLGLFAAIALILALVGIYGLMNYSVTDRFHEIGIRLSLGASRLRLVWLLVSDGLKLTVAGIVVGIAGALVATRVLQATLFGVTPWDPLTFTSVVLCLLIAAIVACLVPALRATGRDPATALRTE